MQCTGSWLFFLLDGYKEKQRLFEKQQHELEVYMAESAKHKKDLDRYKDMFGYLRSTFPASVTEGE